MNLFDILCWHGTCCRQVKDEFLATPKGVTALPIERDIGIKDSAKRCNFLQAGFHPSPVFPRPKPGVFLYRKSGNEGPPKKRERRPPKKELAESAVALSRLRAFVPAFVWGLSFLFFWG
jgi:hypothetical protein